MSKSEITIINPHHSDVAKAASSDLVKVRRAEAWADAVKIVAFFGFLSVAFYSTCNAVCG